MPDLRSTFAADLQKLTTALPVSVSLTADGAAIGTGSWQIIRDDTLFQNIGASREDVRQILLPRATFPSLPLRNTLIFCDGEAYRVHEITAVDVIAITITLLKVNS